ncbi:TPA: DUF4376 domain-containing protein [Salmonella enterica subsp. enterica serovar Anatum]
MTEPHNMNTGITAVRNAMYLYNGGLFAEVQFDDATNADGTPRYVPLTLSTEPYSPNAALLADVKARCNGEILIPPGLTDVMKRAKRADINAWRDAQENGNYLFEYNGHRWDYGKTTQDRMAISLTMAKQNKLPAGFAWTDGDNNIVPMDNAGLIALAAAMEQAMFEKGMQINQRQLQMKAEVEALTEPDAIRSYTVGWPEGS